MVPIRLVCDFVIRTAEPQGLMLNPNFICLQEYFVAEATILIDDCIFACKSHNYYKQKGLPCHSNQQPQHVDFVKIPYACRKHHTSSVDNWYPVYTAF